MDSYFYLFIRLLSASFLSNKTRSNCAIIGCMQFVKETQTITVQNTEQRVKLRRS